VGKIAEKVVRRSVLLTTWHCILRAKLTKNALLQTVFWRFSHWVIPYLRNRIFFRKLEYIEYIVIKKCILITIVFKK